MQLSNKHGLPSEVVAVLTKNRYIADDIESGHKTDFSATTLISPIQQVVLKSRYPDAGCGDVVDLCWSMFGSIAHSLLEEHGSDNSLVEKRFYTTVLDKVISGQIDNYNLGKITDYKTTSAYKITSGSFKEWEKQLNIYAYMARVNGYEVNHLRIIAIVRDWSERDAFKQSYPQAPIVEIPLTLWSFEEQEAFLYERVMLLNINSERPDDLLDLCSSEDMWASPDKWAVQKIGAKRATKIFDTEEEAWDAVGDGQEIVKRSGERRRCSKYCQVSAKCVQHAQYLKELNKDV